MTFRYLQDIVCFLGTQMEEIRIPDVYFNEFVTMKCFNDGDTVSWEYILDVR